MELDIYWITFLTLLPTVILLLGRNLFLKALTFIIRLWGRPEQQEPAQRLGEKLDPTSSLLSTDEKTTGLSTISPPTQLSKHHEIAQFHKTFLPIYLLVMSSEWLSGPYLYPLLRDDRGLPESTVCALYATAYTSAAVSALVTGFLADRYGRRKACLAECVIHSVACLTVIFGGDSLPVLFLGRVLAGTALTLLWTVFESWMVTEWNARELNGEGESGGGEMSRMFGLMTTANCMTAIVGGVVWPFGVGIVMEGIAAVLMLKTMNENYGVKIEERDDGVNSTPEMTGRGRIGGEPISSPAFFPLHINNMVFFSVRMLTDIPQDGRLWALALVTCCFEGTNFLVVFFWPSVLQDAHNEALDIAGEIYTPQLHDVPYGVVFASFMAAMILGALLFSAYSGSNLFREAGASAARSPVCLLISAVIIASLSLLSLSALRGEVAQFCTFLVFEVANGAYIPSMAYIRGLVVDDRSRTGLYGLMKVPLFLFVILALGITAEDALTIAQDG
ncbi:hypothetical protein M406DRAFT_69455 [Cryphonectria parasitica EP155]|uniref:Molybdate-anion transporter n=1 Tax=Cryphonectria parasitica (strain ATCC 38755 / EP155) TaxID=660469 RepID=A0A9P4Y722_CRYP1|nr:uncharacterized protein M406DRAFT_69455 [Cryphonectria parasitica EP155]KAF3767295.1 hypothetical protein M406DRAFT_69455 [Cryphonectria parasitica EP155]